ncbi:MAG: hypothetical protein AB1641_22155 [Thermodesulfobacteriota bacterium]
MKAITIHDLDKPLADLIKARAQTEGLSLNKTVKKLLEEALGITPAPRGKNRPEFEEFRGLWSKPDLLEFDKRTKGLRKIDPEDWR